MNRYVERVISHAVLLLDEMVIAARGNAVAQRKLRDAIVLLRAAADMVDSVGRIDVEARVH